MYLKIKTKILLFFILLPIGLIIGLFFSWCLNAILTKNMPNFQDFQVSVILEKFGGDLTKGGKTNIIINMIGIINRRRF